MLVFASEAEERFATGIFTASPEGKERAVRPDITDVGYFKERRSLGARGRTGLIIFECSAHVTGQDAAED